MKDEPSFILKTHRIQYVFERFRLAAIEREPRTLVEHAETQLVSEVRFWAAKYIAVSWLIGLNVAFLGYHLAFKNLKRYVGLPLTVATFFVTRNLVMRNCMDKIYYPLHQLYKAMKAEEKQLKASKATAAPLPEDRKRHEFIQEHQRQVSAEAQAEEEVRQEKEQAQQVLDDYIFKVHGRFVNESDFYPGDPAATEEQRKAAY